VASPGGGTVVPALFFRTTVPPGVGDALDQLSLTRNGTQLSSVVEDLQVEYWVEPAPPACNGIMDANEFPIHDLNQTAVALDIERVRLVRLSVIARAQIEDEQAGARVDRYRLPATANRVAGAADGFRRRRFSTSVMPRNLLAQPNPELNGTNCGYVP